MLVANKVWAMLWTVEEMSSPFIQTRLVVHVWRPNMVRAQPNTHQIRTGYKLLFSSLFDLTHGPHSSHHNAPYYHCARRV